MPIIPLSVDVTVNLSRGAIYPGLDLSLAIGLTTDVNTSGDGLLLVTSVDDVAAAGYATNSATYRAAATFFAQSPRPQKLGIFKFESAGASSLADAITAASEASTALGQPGYGWFLIGSTRTDANAAVVASLIEAMTAIFAYSSGSADILDAALTSDIASAMKDAGYKRTAVIYHAQATDYPEVSLLARMLSVDYAGTDTTITAKFKALPSVTVQSQITMNDLQAIENKRANVYAQIGGRILCYRQGTMAAPSWFMDSVVNLDNFIEELRTELYNVFTKNSKVPYTADGQLMLVNAASKICGRYTVNGTFAPRAEAAEGTLEGYLVRPATDIQPMPIYTATDSDRAQRLVPPLMITCYEAGAIHKLVVNVTDII